MPTGRRQEVTALATAAEQGSRNRGATTAGAPVPPPWPRVPPARDGFNGFPAAAPPSRVCRRPGRGSWPRTMTAWRTGPWQRRPLPVESKGGASGRPSAAGAPRTPGRDLRGRASCRRPDWPRVVAPAPCRPGIVVPVPRYSRVAFRHLKPRAGLGAVLGAERAPGLPRRADGARRLAWSAPPGGSRPGGAQPVRGRQGLPENRSTPCSVCGTGCDEVCGRASRRFATGRGD
jgi:hypothetical protein